MFEDLEEESVDVTPDSPDRAIAWAIWSRDEAGGVTPDEGWAILHERYPDDLRFLLLSAYTELSETRKQSEGRIKVARATDGSPASTRAAKVEVGVWSHGYFLKKLEVLAAGAPESIVPQLRDLVVFGSALLALTRGEEATRLTALKAKIAGLAEGEPNRDDRDRAGIRLRRFEREVLKEVEERTQENKPLGTRASAPAAAQTASGKDEWATATSDTSRPRRRYAADERYARGELVEHPKFGVGVVTGTEPGKAVILFESGVRKLIAGA
jgi:hypothetical protein